MLYRTPHLMHGAFTQTQVYLVLVIVWGSKTSAWLSLILKHHELLNLQGRVECDKFCDIKTNLPIVYGYILDSPSFDPIL